MSEAAVARIELASDSPAVAWPLSRLEKLGAWVFAILLPAVGFVIAARGGVFGIVVVPVLAFAALAMATMGAWLHAPNVGPRGHALAAGVFLAAAIVATPIVIAVTPLTAYVGVYALGYGSPELIARTLLGCVPILGLVAYSRAAVRAWRLSRGRRRWTSIVAVLALGLPGLAAYEIRSLARADEQLVLDETCSLEGVPLERWRLLAPWYRWPRLNAAWAPDLARRRRIEDACRRMTGD